jgi:hypothetical protein
MMITLCPAIIGLPCVKLAAIALQDHNTHTYAHEQQQFEVMPSTAWLLHLATFMAKLMHLSVCQFAGEGN